MKINSKNLILAATIFWAAVLIAADWTPNPSQVSWDISQNSGEAILTVEITRPNGCYYVDNWGAPSYSGDSIILEIQTLRSDNEFCVPESLKSTYEYNLGILNLGSHRVIYPDVETAIITVGTSGLTIVEFIDSDSDELSDSDEVNVHNTNPNTADTDGDGMPDGYEIANDLDPNRDDTLEDKDFDFVSNIDEYNNSLSANEPMSSGDSLGDYHALNGENKRVFRYDQNDRLVAVQSSEGLAIGYKYDRNSNPIGEKWTQGDENRNGINDLDEYLFNLSETQVFYSSLQGDIDRDGWSTWQEIMMLSNPNDASSIPRQGLSPETDIVNLDMGFDYSGIIKASGQLDGKKGKDIILGATGLPDSENNYLQVLLSDDEDWTDSTINLGTDELTSLGVEESVVGADYGRILTSHIHQDGTSSIRVWRRSETFWQSEVVSSSLDTTALIHGIDGNTAYVQLTLTPEKPQALYSIDLSSNDWKKIEVSAEQGLNIRGASLRGINDEITELPQPTAYWPLNQNGLDATSTYSGSAENGAQYTTAAISSNAVLFDGANDYFDTGYRNGFSNALTISAWINLSSGSKVQGIFGGTWEDGTIDMNFLLSVNASDRILIFGRDGDSSTAHQHVSNASVKIQEWTHVALVWDATENETKLYIDGSLDSKKSFGTNFDSQIEMNGNAFIGANPDWRSNSHGQINNPFHGSIDDVILWGNVLEDTEISTIYNKRGEVTYEDGKLGYPTNTRNTSVLRILNNSTLQISTVEGEVSTTSDYPLPADASNSSLVSDTDNLYLSYVSDSTGNNSHIFSKINPESGVLTQVRTFQLPKKEISTTAAEWIQNDETTYAFYALDNIIQYEPDYVFSELESEVLNIFSGHNESTNNTTLYAVLPHPLADNLIELRHWKPRPNFWDPSTFKQTTATTQITNTELSGGADARINLRIWDSDYGTVVPEVQYFDSNLGSWQNATLVNDVGLPFSAGNKLLTSPSGTNSSIFWKWAQDIASQPTDLSLRVRTLDNQGNPSEWTSDVSLSVNQASPSSDQSIKNLATVTDYRDVGDLINIDLDLLNSGSESISSSEIVLSLLDIPNAVTETKIDLGAYTTPQTNPAEQIPLSLQFTVPLAIEPRDYYLLVELNPKNIPVEYSRSDNTLITTEPLIKIREMHSVERTITPSLAGSISVTPNPNTNGKFLSGSTLKLTAVPTPEMEFVKWLGDLSGSDNPISKTLYSDIAVRAEFQLNDLDGDGVLNKDEEDLGTLANNPDTDGDSLSDGLERDMGLDPTVASDGFLDYVKANPETFGLYDETAIRNLNVGQPVVSLENGKVVVRMRISESTNLTDWDTVGDPAEWEFTPDGDGKFWRINVGE